MKNWFSLSGSYRKDVLQKIYPEMATLGLHDYLFNLINIFLDKPYSALDLGSGSGAWGLRLAKGGNKIKGINLDPKDSPIDCVKANLNDKFSNYFSETFDIITCIEVLEHVENPRNVFCEAKFLLKHNGIFLISTPNCSGLYSRLKFFFTGRFAMFDDFQYEDIGHITPLTYWQIEKMFQENGFNVVSTDSFDATPLFPKTMGDCVKRASWILRPLMRGFVGTQHLIVVGRKEN